jgi:hypothetical protein
MSRKKNGKNLKLAGLFIIFVLGLIVFSTLFKFLLIVKASKFDGSHNFIVGFIGKNVNKVVSFSPQNRSISILDVNIKDSNNNLSRLLEIPIDGTIISQNPNKDNISSVLFKSAFSLDRSLKNLSTLDAFRLFLFSKTVSPNNIAQRKLLPEFNDAQKSTIILLSLTDSSIYRENQSIQIINAADVHGAGTRLATLITNIGGNVVMISTSDETIQNSKIVYYGNESYTVKKLSSYLDFPAIKADKRGMADVIITIGKDKAGNLKF